MQSLQSLTVKAYFKWKRYKRAGKHYSIQVIRKYFERQANKLPSVKNLQVEMSETIIDGIPSTWFTPISSPSKPLVPHIIYYLHGGGYAICSVKTHKRLIAHTAKACNAKIVAIDYRLAPEHPFPAAIEDALTVYQNLLQSYAPSQIILMGDSAGGGLATASMLKMKELQLPQPKAAILLSPWVDLDGENESYHTKASKRPHYCGSRHSPILQRLLQNHSAKPSPHFPGLCQLIRFTTHVDSSRYTRNPLRRFT